MFFPHQLLLKAYGALWRAAQPLLRRHKRLKPGFEQRLVPDDWFSPPPAHPEAEPVRLWVQAASGGEAWLAHSLLPALREAFAEYPFLAGRPLHALCTTLTEQGLEVLEKFPQSDGILLAARHCPLDRPDIMRKAMSMAAPELVILLETELWPGLLAAAKARGTPVLVANGRMTRKSLVAYRLTRAFWRSLAPAAALAVSDEDAARFADLFGPRTETGIMSNIKFDRVAQPPRESDDEAAAAMRAILGLAPTHMLAAFASVREEEEEALLGLIGGLRGRTIGPQALPLALAVAPRHMHRADAWMKKLLAAGIPLVRRSALGETAHAPVAGEPPVYLWDSFGELARLYAAADTVFVGGSLAPLGGQNFLEPLGLGVAPVVGPHTGNFRWVGEELFDSGLAARVDSTENLDKALMAALAKRAKFFEDRPPDEARALARREVREYFQSWLRPRLGGSGQAAEAAARLLS